MTSIYQSPWGFPGVPNHQSTLLVNQDFPDIALGIPHLLRDLSFLLISLMEGHNLTCTLHWAPQKSMLTGVSLNIRTIYVFSSEQYNLNANQLTSYHRVLPYHQPQFDMIGRVLLRSFYYPTWDGSFPTQNAQHFVTHQRGDMTFLRVPCDPPSLIDSFTFHKPRQHPGKGEKQPLNPLLHVESKPENSPWNLGLFRDKNPGSWSWNVKNVTNPKPCTH